MLHSHYLSISRLRWETFLVALLTALSRCGSIQWLLNCFWLLWVQVGIFRVTVMRAVWCMMGSRCIQECDWLATVPLSASLLIRGRNGEVSVMDCNLATLCSKLLMPCEMHCMCAYVCLYRVVIKRAVRRIYAWASVPITHSQSLRHLECLGWNDSNFTPN